MPETLGVLVMSRSKKFYSKALVRRTKTDSPELKQNARMVSERIKRVKRNVVQQGMNLISWSAKIEKKNTSPVLTYARPFEKLARNFQIVAKYPQID